MTSHNLYPNRDDVIFTEFRKYGFDEFRYTLKKGEIAVKSLLNGLFICTGATGTKPIKIKRIFFDALKKKKTEEANSNVLLIYGEDGIEIVTQSASLKNIFEHLINHLHFDFEDQYILKFGKVVCNYYLEEDCLVIFSGYRPDDSKKVLTIDSSNVEEFLKEMSLMVRFFNDTEHNVYKKLQPKAVRFKTFERGLMINGERYYLIIKPVENHLWNISFFRNPAEIKSFKSDSLFDMYHFIEKTALNFQRDEKLASIIRRKNKESIR